MTRFDALRRIPQLAASSDQEISTLSRYADQVYLKAGEVVAEKGRLCDAFVVVMEGTLRSADSRFGPGASIGWEAMWQRSHNPATVIADSDVRILVMSHAQFRAVKGLTAAVPGLPRIEECSPRPSRSALTSVSSSSIAGR